MARPIQRVENYATPALVMGFVNLIWVFGVIWVVWGLPAVMLTGLAINYTITFLERRVRNR